MESATPITDAIIKIFTSELLGQGPVAYADHQNMLVDLGWDVSCGDGQIVDLIRDQITCRVFQYPECGLYLIWSETFDAGFERRRFIEAVLGKGDISDLLAPDKDEILEQIITHLSERAYTSAENAYNNYKEEEYDETEYIDE